MNSTVLNREQRVRLERRNFLLVLAAAAVVALSVLGLVYGPTYYVFWNYSPKEGDIVFQSLPHMRLVDAIEGVTESPYSHCGIIAKQDGQWVVYEAFQNVEVTPLKEFLFRGRSQGFAVYRLKSEYQDLVPETLERVRGYLGLPYDARYRMDNDRIYCSELIYKAYRDASGQPLGKLARLGDLNWKPFEDTIKYYEKGPVPLEREMITPKDMALADQLQLILSHRISTAQP